MYNNFNPSISIRKESKLATFKMSNPEGSIAEFHIDIFGKKAKMDNKNYSYQNNILTQKVKIDFLPGAVKTYKFPITYKNFVRSVHISNCDEVIKKFIYIVNWDKEGFTVNILPCPNNYQGIIEATAFGE